MIGIRLLCELVVEINQMDEVIYLFVIFQKLSKELLQMKRAKLIDHLPDTEKYQAHLEILNC